ncbi:MAG: helix-turn-helix transcriptional regulator [Spirochaetota bacterium]|nr:MAG: helix-turn-helix transcriptional regulator [Spirochaetota bacterium]
MDILLTPENRHKVVFSKECPVEIRCYTFSFNHHLTPNYHDFLEITYVYNGNGIIHIEDKKYDAVERDLFVIGNTEFHTFEADLASSLKTISLYFLPEFVYSIGQNSFDLDYLRPFLDHSIEFENRIPLKEFNTDVVFDLIENIYEEKLYQNDFYQLAVKNYLLEMLVLIARYFKRFSSDLSQYTKRRADIKRLDKVLSFLQTHYHENIPLDNIAKIACMSTCYFCKFFKNVTGKTFKEYIMRLRIDKARELLLQNDLNITEIAYEVGFENLSYFDRIFRRLTNLSPHDYRITLMARSQKLAHFQDK